MAVSDVISCFEIVGIKRLIHLDELLICVVLLGVVPYLQHINIIIIKLIRQLVCIISRPLDLSHAVPLL